jgi:predicted Zn-dependent protease with MMP-like domain
MAEQATYAPDLDRIEQLARAALERLPSEFRAYLGDVVLRVEDFADDATLDQMGIADPFDLTGLYSGRPVGDKSSSDSGALPDMIYLYRRPILDEWAETGVSLEALVTHVLVHEVGHHFGLSDADMHALEDLAG